MSLCLRQKPQESTTLPSPPNQKDTWQSNWGPGTGHWLLQQERRLEHPCQSCGSLSMSQFSNLQVSVSLSSFVVHIQRGRTWPPDLPTTLEGMESNDPRKQAAPVLGIYLHLLSQTEEDALMSPIQELLRMCEKELFFFPVISHRANKLSLHNQELNHQHPFPFIRVTRNQCFYRDRTLRAWFPKLKYIKMHTVDL